MTNQKTPQDIEREGFIKMTAVALGANMAAATIHAGIQLDWKKIVPNAMAGANEFWKAIQEDRK
jgi:hypothetical protein